MIACLRTRVLAVWHITAAWFENPTTAITTTVPWFVAPLPASGEDSWLIVASDGLFAEESRGGGGGLDNEQLVQMLQVGGSTQGA
jgi:hypothetical protein